MSVRSCVGALVIVFSLSFLPAARADLRTTVSQKGSLLIFPAVELKWNGAGALVQDTVLHLVNDSADDVLLQVYYINGDAPREPVFAGDPPVLVTEGEPGWNRADCQLRVTGNQSLSWSAAFGSATACQPFNVIDPGGRPDPEGPAGSRVLRGFVYVWAINTAGEEIRWNHLSGHALVVDYGSYSAWEYGAYAFQVNSGVSQGEPTDGNPGQLLLNGVEYDACYDALLFDFYSSGAAPFSGSGLTGAADTDLTLFTVESDLRETGFGLVSTIARFEIWNQNETKFSGTQRRITCWHQMLLSDYGIPNNFLRATLQTDRGKARINGLGSTSCDPRDLPAALLGVAAKRIVFSGAATGSASTGGTLIGQGCEDASILYDPLGGAVAALGKPAPGRTIGDGQRRVDRSEDGSASFEPK